MNKELVIHLVVGSAAVGALYWLWTKYRATPATSAGLTAQETADINAGTSLAQTQTSTWYGIVASGGDYGQSAY